jgi:predicted GIY-YIG superfamily endonuclease
LIGYEEHETQSDARFREYEMKNHSDKKRQFVDRITGVSR